jgi:hypothetical protein
MRLYVQRLGRIAAILAVFTDLLLLSMPITAMGLIGPICVGSLFCREPPSPGAVAHEGVWLRLNALTARLPGSLSPERSLSPSSPGPEPGNPAGPRARFPRPRPGVHGRLGPGGPFSN